MHILHVHAHVKPEHIEAFKLATIDNAGNSVKEPGCARFDVIQQTDDPTRFVLVEVYHKPEDHAKHRQTAHYLAWVDKTLGMFAEERTRTVYLNIFPANQGW
jgi:quinol monooxygenase YgiN